MRHITFAIIAAIAFGSANVALAQSNADSSRSINGPANSDTANQDAHRTVHGHMARHHQVKKKAH